MPFLQVKEKLPEAGKGSMEKVLTPLEGVFLLKPRVFGDQRGFFLESYSQRMLAGLGIQTAFVQDNHSYSARNVVRGLHYQIRQAQGKLIRVVEGEIFDVVVDLRENSPTFGHWSGVVLSGENKHMLWVPPGFAHGFGVASEGAHVLYKATDYYAPEWERTLAWNDPGLKIDWQLTGEAIVSAKDQAAALFRDAEKFR